jgi:hypothetical protein
MNLTSAYKAIEDLDWEHDEDYFPSTDNSFKIKAYFYHDLDDHLVYLLTISECLIRIIEKGHSAKDNVTLFEGTLCSCNYRNELSVIMKQTNINLEAC